MSRKLRISCPGCRAVLQATATAEQRLDVTCPRCNKHFVAKVRAPRPQPVVASGIASVGDDKWSAALGVPPPPKVPQVQFATTRQFDYYGMTPRGRINYKPWLLAGAVVLGLCITAPLLWLAGSAVGGSSGGDWSAFTLMPDSTDQLIDDYLHEVEKGITWSLAHNIGDKNYREELATLIKSNQRVSENLLVRAVKLPKAGAELKSEFKAKSKAVAEKYRDHLMSQAKQASANASQLGLTELQQDKELQEALAMRSAADVFIATGLWELPAPENDVERIYSEDLEITGEFLRSLASVNSKSRAQSVHVAIDKLTDRSFELAVRRTKLPRSFFERVPQEYNDAERGLSFAQRALVRRIERNYEMPEALKDAITNFAFARSCIDQAASGTSEPVLRKLLADMRATRAKTLSRPDKELIPVAERDLASMPAVPLPALEPAPSSELTTPTNEHIADDTSPSAAEPTESPGSGQLQVADDEHLNFAPTAEDGQYSKRGPYGQDRNGISPTPSLESHRARFSGAGSVIINVSNNQHDASSLVKRLAEQLSIKEYFCHGNNSDAVIGLRFDGPLEEVVTHIDFGKVLSVDSGQRVIVVRGNER